MRSVVLATGALSVSGSQDLTCDEEAVFLQTPSSPLHLLHPDDENDEPAFLLKAAKNLARQATRQTPEAVTAGIDSINAALGQMTTRLEEGHDRAEQRIQAQVEEIQACHSSSSHGVAVNDDLSGQLATMTACHEDQATASQAQQVKCNAWDSHASRLAFPATNLPASASSRERYLIAEQLRDWVDTEWSAIESQNAECEEATSYADAETERCAPVIANYNEVFCQHHLACNLLSACHRHELEVYQSLRSESEVGMASRQAQFRTVKQTECLLGLITEALRANTTIEESAFDTCDGNADDQHLELSFPDPEPSVACPHPQAADPHCPEILLPVAWAGGEAEPPEGPAFLFGMFGSKECPGTGYTFITDDSLCREAVEYAAALDTNPEWMRPTITDRPPQDTSRAFENIGYRNDYPCGCNLWHTHTNFRFTWHSRDDNFVPFLNARDAECGTHDVHYDTAPVCQCPQGTSCQPPAESWNYGAVNPYDYFLQRTDGNRQWECPEGSSSVDDEQECLRAVTGSGDVFGSGVTDAARLREPNRYDPPGCYGHGENIWWNSATWGDGYYEGGDWRAYWRVCKREATPA